MILIDATAISCVPSSAATGQSAPGSLACRRERAGDHVHQHLGSYNHYLGIHMKPLEAPHMHLLCQWKRAGDVTLLSARRHRCRADCDSPDHHESVEHHSSTSTKGTLAVKVQSTQERFYEALAPLGMPDLPTKSSGTGQRPSRVSKLKYAAEAVGRWSMITAAVVLIHLATLKFIFWPI